MRREFVQHTGFGERVFTIEQSLSEGADHTGVKAVETAKAIDIAVLGRRGNDASHRVDLCQPIYLTQSTYQQPSAFVSYRLNGTILRFAHTPHPCFVQDVASRPRSRFGLTAL